jgi:hypothetical protein
MTSLPDGLPIRHLHAPATAALLALAGSTLAVATGEGLILLDPDDGRELRRTPLPWEAHELAIAPSGRFLAVGPRQPRSELFVLDALAGRAGMIRKLPGHWLAGFGFSGADRLLVSRDQRSLTVYEPDGEWRELTQVDTAGVEPDTIVPLGGDRMAVVGHHKGEDRDVLHTLAVADPAPGFRRELDLAYRLVAGPAPEGVVAFRDPEDIEEPDPDDDEVDGHDLYGFKGVYIRSLSAGRPLRERFAWDGPVQAGDACFATERWIAVAMREALALIDRRGNATSFPATATAADPSGRRVVVAEPAGGLAVISVPSAR